MTNNDDIKIHMIYAFRCASNRFIDHYNNNKHKLLSHGKKLIVRSGGEADLISFFDDKIKSVFESSYENLLPIMHGGISTEKPIVSVTDGHYTIKANSYVTTKYNTVLATYAAIDLKLMFEIYPLSKTFKGRMKILDEINIAQQFPDFNRGDRHIKHIMYNAFKDFDNAMIEYYKKHNLDPYKG